MEQSMAKKRKVDTLATGGLLARLKARRQAVEAGDLTGAPHAYRQGKYTAKQRTNKVKRYTTKGR
jgi:hypothetical protein